MTINVATPRIVTTTDDGMEVRRARQGLLVFAAFLIPLSLFGYWFNIKYPDLNLNFSVMPMMFAPGLASIITRLVRREGFADVSFRLRGNGMRSAYLPGVRAPLGCRNYCLWLCLSQWSRQIWSAFVLRCTGFAAG